jgi:hypothetical protein
MNLNEAVSDLKKLERLAEGLTRRRNDIYLLLAEIYRVGLKWLKLGPADLKRKLIAHLERKFDRRTTRSVFRFLIEVTLKEVGPKAKQRYANAVRYPHMRHCPSQRLADFMKRNGGIERCEDLFLAARKAKARSAAP